MGAEEFQSKMRTVDVVIASGATDSSAAALYGVKPCRLSMPAAFTGTSVSFKSSRDGVNFNALYDDAGALVSVPVGTSRSVSLGNLVQHFLAMPWVKLVSNGAEGADRTITIVGEPI